MFKAILALAVAAAAYLAAADAEAQAIYLTDAPAEEVSCHETPDQGRVCLTIAAQRIVQELPAGMLPDGRAGRFISALSVIEFAGRSLAYATLTANCTDRRDPVYLADVTVRPDGTRTVGKPKALRNVGADRILADRIRAVLCAPTPAPARPARPAY